MTTGAEKKELRTFGIYLSFNNEEEGFQIPVNPESIEIVESGSGKSYDIVGAGPIQVLQGPELAEISWSSVFPAHQYPFVTVPVLYEPSRYITLLRKWMDTKRPIRFIYKGVSIEITTPASIEKFEWKEVAGSPGDLEYTISLKRYVFYAARKVEYVADGDKFSAVLGPPTRADERWAEPTYTVQPGDTLRKIAMKWLKDETRADEIRIRNNLTDAEARKLTPGKVLEMPVGRMDEAWSQEEE